MMLLPTLQRCWPFPDLVVAVLALLSEGCRSPPGRLLLAAEIIINIISIVIMNDFCLSHSIVLLFSNLR